VSAFPLSDADPLAIVVAFLNAHPAVIAAHGGTDRVGGTDEPPYPRSIVKDIPGGDARGLRWLYVPELSLETYADLDGSPGKAALRRIHYETIGALMTLPNQAFGPNDPVVAAILPQGGGGYIQDRGRHRYIWTAGIALHPANSWQPS
jgi:hypothetical protein